MNLRWTLAAAVAFCAVSTAQQQRLPISRTLTSTLKADRVADFVAAVKDYNAAYAKIPGGRARIQYQSLTGANRYRLVTSYADWAAMDAPSAVAGNAEIARAMSRINSCIDSSTTVITELLPDLSTPQASGAPNLLRITTVRVRRDKVQEWLSIVKNEMLPAYKKAGRTLTVRQARFGAQTNEFYLTTRIANWADAGKNPILDAMGKEAYDRMAAKISAITTLLERDIFRYRADMSWSPNQ